MIPCWLYVFTPHKLGSGLTSTLMPLFIVQVMGGSVADVGRISSLAALAGVPGSILWGNLSDRLGRRRPFLLLGFLGFGLATLLVGAGRSITQLLVFSIVGRGRRMHWAAITCARYCHLMGMAAVWLWRLRTNIQIEKSEG